MSDNSTPNSDLQELADSWRETADQKMAEIDTTASHYTGNTGSLCLGLKIAADELEMVIDDED